MLGDSLGDFKYFINSTHFLIKQIIESSIRNLIEDSYLCSVNFRRDVRGP